MVRGLINRRYWFAFTDRIEEANFVWTQLKQHEYFRIQKTSEHTVKKLENIHQYAGRSCFTLSDLKKYKTYW
jgi:hypothetical protein